LDIFNYATLDVTLASSLLLMVGILMGKKLLKNTAYDVTEIADQLVKFISHYKSNSVYKLYRLISIMGSKETQVLPLVLKKVNTKIIPLIREVYVSLESFVQLHIKGTYHDFYLFNIFQLNIIISLKDRLENYDSYVRTAAGTEKFKNLLLNTGPE
jgi:hypothetical protein